MAYLDLEARLCFKLQGLSFNPAIVLWSSWRRATTCSTCPLQKRQPSFGSHCKFFFSRCFSTISCQFYRHGLGLNPFTKDILLNHTIIVSSETQIHRPLRISDNDVCKLVNLLIKQWSSAEQFIYVQKIFYKPCWLYRKLACTQPLVCSIDVEGFPRVRTTDEFED